MVPRLAPGFRRGDAKSSRTRTAGFVFLAGILSAGWASAEDEDSGFFSWAEWTPPPIEEALVAYAEGRFVEAVSRLAPVLVDRSLDYARDEAHLVRARSFAALGWEEQARRSLDAVLDMRPPSPYYALAVLTLVEMQHRNDRPDAVVDVYRRRVRGPLAASDAEARELRSRIYDFGNLRGGSEDLSPRENALLSRPEELAVLLEGRRDRASDRIFYISGLALLREGMYRECLEAFRRIDIESPYYPYALHAMAQVHVAVEEPKKALRLLRRLDRYPALTPAELVLEDRALLLEAHMLFTAEKLERGARMAGSIPAERPDAPVARLMAATAFLDQDEPALALVYHGDAEGGDVEMAGRRALVLGSAHLALGDPASAEELLRAAARKLAATREHATDETSRSRIRSLVESHLRERSWRDRREREALVEGLRQALVYEGPWSLWKLFEVARASLGARPYFPLERGLETVPEGEPVSREEIWLAFLQSPRRDRVEALLGRALDLESPGGGRTLAAAVPVVDAYLFLLEDADDDVERDGLARRAAGLVDWLRSATAPALPVLELETNAPLEPRMASWREQTAFAGELARIGPKELWADLAAFRGEAATLLRVRADREIEAILRRYDGRLTRLELELEATLGDVLLAKRKARR